MTKIRKKILLSTLLTLMLMTVLVLSVSAANEWPYVYEIENAQVTITDCDPNLEGEITIPEKLGGIPVTAIGEKAFYYCSSITKVTVGENIRSIGKMAFGYCGALEEVILPESLEKIEDETFYMCFNLSRVRLSHLNITSIGKEAFANCEYIESITLPDKLRYVAEGAFNWCSSLTNVIIGKSTKSIAENAFSNCYNIRSVYYMGTQQEFSSIAIAKGNDKILSGDIYYDHIHVYDDVETVSKGDCTVKGRKIYTCRCSDSYNEFDFAPHTYKTTTTKASFTKNGKIVKKCTLCGEVGKKTVIPKVSVSLSTTAATYNGKVKTPEVTVKNTEGSKLTADKSYTVKYSSGRKEIGKYAVRVTLKGSKYSGTTKVYFNVVPAKADIKAASVTDSSAKLSWSKVTGATGYKLYSYNADTKKYKAIKTVSSTEYTVTGLEAGVENIISVRAYSKVDGETIWGSHSKIKILTEPAAVKLSSVSSGDAGKATVKWTKTAADGYEVYMATAKTAKYKKIKTVTKYTTVSYTKSSLTSGNTYYFKVRAYKTTDDGKLYGDFGNVKSVRIK